MGLWGVWVGKAWCSMCGWCVGVNGTRKVLLVIEEWGMLGVARDEVKCI